MDNKKIIRIDELDVGHPLRQDPFRTPDGYFDALPMQIQARIQAQQPTPAFTLSWSWQRTAATLAGAGLVAALVWVTLPQRQESLGQEALSSVSNEAILAYLDEQGIDANDMTDQVMTKASISSDSTMFQYMNIKPDDIRRHVDEHQESMDELIDLGS